jgi:hypothetical protein
MRMRHGFGRGGNAAKGNGGGFGHGRKPS